MTIEVQRWKPACEYGSPHMVESDCGHCYDRADIARLLEELERLRVEHKRLLAVASCVPLNIWAIAGRAAAEAANGEEGG